MKAYWVTYYDKRDKTTKTGIIYAKGKEEAKAKALRILNINYYDIKKIEE